MWTGLELTLIVLGLLKGAGGSWWLIYLYICISYYNSRGSWTSSCAIFVSPTSPLHDIERLTYLRSLRCIHLTYYFNVGVFPSNEVYFSRLLQTGSHYWLGKLQVAFGEILDLCQRYHLAPYHIRLVQFTITDSPSWAMQ